ncbi:Kelch domain-containing protein 1 [Larimichthys crocea]|uniref:Kelch domain-containing protein 1 n=1 Tax=Larimichthys crocea TaxID=215358 RepID=A0A0F8D379_LARCR|nr:kelch domain-containing protein 1 [Larimichthys crocea]KAE8283954.1 Kelch domain-containing protein 1 [Larimichthys crocea]
MDAAEETAPVSRLERSSHTAFIDNNTLFVWGGYQVVAGADVMLPGDEIWLCDLDSGTWEQKEITGDKPPDLSDFCGAHVNGTLYIFGGCDPVGYTNQMFSLDLTEQLYSWKMVTDTNGTTPSPRNKHSCWVHRDRLIYFGGYGCKTIGEVRNTSSTSFIVEEMSWTAIGNALFRCWGWNNEVNVFDTHTATWSMPETRGPVPAPRGCHASALLGNKGYISGGVETAALDMFCLDLETWTWTQFDLSQSCTPLGRSMFTMTSISDHTLFIYGGLGTDGNTLNDAWQFNTQKKEWTKMTHPHKDKPRVCHTACLGSDDDVVVFGGSSDMHFLMDSMTVLRAPSQNHCKDVLIFQTQPYSLYRLCEDFLGRNPELFGLLLDWLPPKLRNKVDKRVAFFSAATPVRA